LWLTGNREAARDAACIAAGLSNDPSVRRFLLEGGYTDEPSGRSGEN
jgi:RNA polymerase sigma-70 factor, ECF subfamily